MALDRRLARVQVFLLDLDGTVNLGNRLLPGALEFFDVLERHRRDYLFLTNNSSRNARHYAAKLSQLGIPVSEDKVLTSGEATARWLLTAQPTAGVFLMGTPELREEFAGHGVRLEEDAPDLVVLGFDTTLAYARLWRLCDLVRAGLPYVATHADLNCPTEDGFMPDVGSMIALVKTSTGREPDTVIGKPNRLIVEAAAEKAGASIDRLAMVGDRLYTDIALGDSSGILTVLVLSGETKADALAGSAHRPDFVFEGIGALAAWLEAHLPASPV